MDLLLESLNQEWEVVVRMAPRAAIALLVLLVAIVVGRVLGTVVYRWSARSDLTEISRRIIRRVASWSVIVAGLAMALGLVGLGTTAAGLLAGGGASAIVVGFAFRAIFENLLAGLFLAFQRPFQVDDYIQSSGFEGTVKEIDLRNTHIRASDGRDIFIPNAKVFSEPLVNFTADGLRRSKFTVGLEYGEDAAGACRLLHETLVSTPGVLSEPEPLVRLAGLDGTTVRLEGFYWANLFDPETPLMPLQGEVQERVRSALRAAGHRLGAEVAQRVEVTTRTSG
ncbi:MAG: mechanosensitive ion channel family protein [Thermoanaerobaculia bacterium]